MKLCRLDRFIDTRKYGTFGKLFIDGQFQCFTVERPWRDNEPFKSCIPKGAYLMKKGTFRDDYENYEVRNVKGRTHIEIHVANRARDVQGCIGLGTDVGVISGEWAVLNSKPAMEAFVEASQRDEYMVLIIHDPGVA